MNNSIVQKDDKVLREIAKEVPISKINSAEIKSILKRMQKALDAEEDGVAIAAPQIGVSLRIFIVSKRVHEIMEEENRHKKREENQNESMPSTKNKDMIFINPEIIKTSRKKIPMEEGCLSVRWLYGKVLRSEKTLIRAYNEGGKKITMGGSGILSQIFQHETDHLNGTLFIDKATELKNLPPEDTK